MVGPYPVSEKCRYALRAIFDLALRATSRPVKIQEIASSQRIPQRFLEIILAELKHGGFVESRRGADGGYVLARPAYQLSIGEVIRFMQGDPKNKLSTEVFEFYLPGDHIFRKVWEKVTAAVAEIYDNTTFADLVEEELAGRAAPVSNYVI